MNRRYFFPLGCIVVSVIAPAAFYAAAQSDGDSYAITIAALTLFIGVDIAIVSLIVTRPKKNLLGLPMLADAGTRSDKRAYMDAHATNEIYRAAVVSQRSLGNELGVRRFGTELTLDVSIAGEDTTGMCREYLTPAQIAQTVPGSTVQVKAVPAHSGLYVLVFPR